MTASELKIGDLIRITNHIPDYSCIPLETKRVWKKLAKRKRPVRISEIIDGQPWYQCRFSWYQCRFRRKNGRLEYHFLSVLDEDMNWTLVKRRNKNG